MIRFKRSARAAGGTALPMVIQWAKEIAEYVSTNYPEATVHAFVEQYGDYGRIHWYADYEDLATLEKVGSRLNTDQGYWAVAEKGAGFLIEGSIQDTLMASV